MPDLVLVFLLVSCLSLVCQVLAFIRLAARRAATPVEELVGGGYLRTVGCRVLVATVYVVVAAVQFAGDGTLTAEALIVWIAAQSIWQLNSLLDVRIRRTLSQHGTPRHAR
jgi:hypothetical protein